MNITVRIIDKRITELLHGHGGSVSPWMQELYGQWNHRTGATVKYGDQRTWIRCVGRADVERGLAIMARKCPNRWGDFMRGDDDDLAFDAAWQCILFGKLVYA